MMSEIVEIKLPKTPPCWDTCGNCATDELTVAEVLVSPGQEVKHGDALMVLETNKVGLEIPSPESGTVLEVLVQDGDLLDPEQVIVRIEVQ